MTSKLRNEFKDTLEILRKYFIVHLIFIGMLGLVYFLLCNTLNEDYFIVNLFISNIDIFSIKWISIIGRLVVCLFFMTITYCGFSKLYNNIFYGNPVDIKTFFTGIKQRWDKVLPLNVIMYIIYFLFYGYFFEFSQTNILISYIIGGILLLVFYYCIALVLSFINEKHWRLNIKRIIKILFSSESLLLLIVLTLFCCVYIIISYLVIIKYFTINAPLSGILIIEQIEYGNRLQVIINIMSIIVAPIIFIFTYRNKTRTIE